jgi:hypothetical protein
VDRLDAGLALVGLAAAGAVVASGGTSATAKVGATLLRLARRIGAVSPRLMAGLGEAVTGLVRWDRLSDTLLGRAPVEAAVDSARWARLTAIAGDVGRLRENTSAAEALVLLREADTVEDLARLARVSEIAGVDTTRVMRVLGPDAFRLLNRVSHLAEAAIGLVALVATQLAAGLAAIARTGLRAILRGPRHGARRRPVA